MTMTRNEVVGSFVADLESDDTNELTMAQLYELSLLAEDAGFAAEAGPEFGVAVGEAVEDYLKTHPYAVGRFAA